MENSRAERTMAKTNRMQEAAEGFGARLREVRLGQALTQEMLAESAELSPDIVSRLETGQRGPRPTTVRKLARALGVGVEVLTGTPYAPVPGPRQRTRTAQAEDHSRSACRARQEWQGVMHEGFGDETLREPGEDELTNGNEAGYGGALFGDEEPGVAEREGEADHAEVVAPVASEETAGVPLADGANVEVVQGDARDVPLPEDSVEECE
jgi:transcriptional regulator with XRE-family HTH domain